MTTRSFLLLGVLTLGLSVSAQAATPSPLRVTPNDITAPNFSLKAELASLKCHGEVTATPLSLVGPVLSVKLSGTLCGDQFNTVNTYSIGQGRTVPTLSELFGERLVVGALKRDPYLNSLATLRGSDMYELESSLMATQSRGDCPLSPSPLEVAQRRYVLWRTSGNQVNVRLALPLSCNGHKTNESIWLGVMLPASALKERIFFDYTTRPQQTARIRF